MMAPHIDQFLSRPPFLPRPARSPLRVRSAGGWAIVTISGGLDLASAPALREQLLRLLRPGASRIVIDLSAVTCCDASGLAVLVGAGRRAGLLGGALRLAAPTPTVAAVLRRTGLGARFEIFATARQAAAAPPRPAGREALLSG